MWNAYPRRKVFHSCGCDRSSQWQSVGIGLWAVQGCDVSLAAIDLQKMNWEFRTGFHEHTGVSLTAPIPNNPIGGYTRVPQDTAQSRHRQRAAQPSAGRLSAR